MNVKLKLVSSLEKVFLDQEPEERPELGIPQGFQNEVISFQAAFTMIDPPVRDYIHVEVDSPIAPQVHVRKVVHVPVRLAAYENCGDNYLRTTPGLYPDLLTEIGEHSLRAYPGQWDSLWVDVKPEGKVAGGVYPVTLRLTNDAGETVAERTQKVEVLPGLLPEQKLIHTKWLHCDCLAQYYHVPVFSEEHWRILENFIKKAVEGGINMILTPVHTPPLDTRRGGERLTTQLVGVTLENGEYRFDMANLRRWIAMCKRCGVKYYEVAHLYSQWGATAAPKIMATVDGEYRRLFGWETTATGEDYRRFLNAYVPALLQVFREEGVDRQTYWHVSDEPSLAQLDDYRAARDQVAGLLEGYCIMDALSNLDFYKTGAVDHPIPANNHIDPACGPITAAASIRTSPTCSCPCPRRATAFWACSCSSSTSRASCSGASTSITPSTPTTPSIPTPTRTEMASCPRATPSRCIRARTDSRRNPSAWRSPPRRCRICARLSGWASWWDATRSRP